jgi:hypothetical protein
MIRKKSVCVQARCNHSKFKFSIPGWLNAELMDTKGQNKGYMAGAEGGMKLKSQCSALG